MYHHSIPLENITYGKIISEEKFADKIFLPVYKWLEKELGFFPLFLSVGNHDEDLKMTGYQNQFRKISSYKKSGNIYRKKDEFPNYILFSFSDLDGIFMDYDNWHIALNSSYKNYNISDYEKRLILKPSWNKSRWLKKSLDNPGTVQFVTKELDLRIADRIWVRNKQTKNTLESIGFDNIEVKQLKIDSI